MNFPLIIGTLFLFSLAALSMPPSAHALIILPPLLLIPIISMLGGMTAILSFPATVFSALITYLRKPKTKKAFVIQTVVTTVVLLTILAAIIFVFLKIQNPNRPTF